MATFYFLGFMVSISLATIFGYYAGRWKTMRRERLESATLGAANYITMLWRIEENDFRAVGNRVEEMLKAEITTRHALRELRWWQGFSLPPMDVSNCEKLIEMHNNGRNASCASSSSET